MTDLTKAIAELQRLKRGEEIDAEFVSIILDAARTGDLIQKAEIEKALSDPTSVHYSMLKGTIAKPTLAQIIHLYGGDLIPRAEADLAAALMVEKAAEIIEEQGQWMKNHNLSGNGFDLIQQGKPIRALAPASALSELQVLRDERDVAIDSATQQDALRKATLATMRSISAENEDLRTELATLRAQVVRLTVAADRLRKMHQMSLRTADYHNINCQCPRCIDDEIVAALTAYEHGRATLTEGAAP